MPLMKTEINQGDLDSALVFRNEYDNNNDSCHF